MGLATRVDLFEKRMAKDVRKYLIYFQARPNPPRNRLQTRAWSLSRYAMRYDNFFVIINTLVAEEIQGYSS